MLPRGFAGRPPPASAAAAPAGGGGAREGRGRAVAEAERAKAEAERGKAVAERVAEAERALAERLAVQHDPALEAEAYRQAEAGIPWTDPAVVEAGLARLRRTVGAPDWRPPPDWHDRSRSPPAAARG